MVPGYLACYSGSTAARSIVMDHLYLASGREDLFPPWGKEGAKEEKLREKGPGPQKSPSRACLLPNTLPHTRHHSHGARAGNTRSSEVMIGKRTAKEALLFNFEILKARHRMKKLAPFYSH